MNQLVKYESACRALAEAYDVDEVKDIHDKAEAMRVYALQSKNVDLEMMAAEIRLRAKQRLGQLISEGKKSGQFRQGRQKTADQEVFRRTTLNDIGVDDKLSRRSQKLAQMPKDVFEAMVATHRQQIADLGAKRAATAAEKTKRRAEREQHLAAKITALPDQKFGVIYADPPWQFAPYSNETGMDRAADNHYPTQTYAAIAQLNVQSIAADDCVLFLWATVPMLPEALAIMKIWGFAYKSHCVWDKQRVGTGYWFRNAHELLLVGTKGDIPAPAPGTQSPSLIEAPATKHSAKPECFLEIIEAYFPTLPKIELYRRGPCRKNWAAWGNQADGAESEVAA